MAITTDRTVVGKAITASGTDPTGGMGTGLSIDVSIGQSIGTRIATPNLSTSPRPCITSHASRPASASFFHWIFGDRARRSSPPAPNGSHSQMAFAFGGYDCCRWRLKCTALMGGAGGLPFAEDAQDLAEGLAQLLGYNISAKKSRQELLEGIFGKGLAEFINSGVSGLPGMPLDVSGRLGMGKLLPGIGLVKDKSSLTRDVLEIAGPAGDFARRILSGGRRMLGGDIGAGMLEMSPQAVRNAAKGVDMAATGMYRDAKGYKVLETSHLEAALKAISFQPASVANVQESNSINQQAKNVYNLKAQEIRSEWASGIFEGDQSQVDDARAAVAHWNRKNPEQPIIIAIPSVMHKVKEMRKPKDQRIADAAPRAMRAQMKAEILARAN